MKPRVRPMRLAAACLCLALAGCSLAMMGSSGSSSGATAASAIAGTVSYRERIALPADALVEVALLDLSRSPTVLSSTSFRSGGAQVPIPFRLQYAANRAPAGGRYALEARIRVAGQLRWSTPEPVPVSLPAAGSVRLLLVAR